jgi:hypothetical protein
MECEQLQESGREMLVERNERLGTEQQREPRQEGVPGSLEVTCSSQGEDGLFVPEVQGRPDMSTLAWEDEEVEDYDDVVVWK